MQIEDVARIRLAARRAAEEQRKGAVGLGVLGKVVVHRQRVHPVVPEVFADRGARERREILHRIRVRGRGHDDHGILEGPVLAKSVHDARHVRHLLTHRDIDTVDRAAAGFVGPALVDDRVDADGGLSGLSVADDEFALAAADRNHRIDGLDAGLERLLHRLAIDDARRDGLEAAELRGSDRPLAVDRLPQRVHHAAEQSLADGNLDDAPGFLDRITLANLRVVADDDGADRVLFEVQGEPHDALGELQQLAHLTVRKTVHAGDAVADLEHGADVLDFCFALELLKLLFEDGGDFFRSNSHSRGGGGAREGPPGDRARGYPIPLVGDEGEAGRPQPVPAGGGAGGVSPARSGGLFGGTPKIRSRGGEDTSPATRGRSVSEANREGAPDTSQTRSSLSSPMPPP